MQKRIQQERKEELDLRIFLHDGNPRYVIRDAIDIP